MRRFVMLAVTAAAALPAGPDAAVPPAPDLPRSPSVGLSRWHEPTLCERGERIAWSCRAGRRTISVCASPRISATAGYIQYRIGRPGRLELQHPATRVHPRGRFRYSLAPNGNTSLEFDTGGHTYAVFEALREPEDGVLVMKGDRIVSEITCNGGGEGFNIVRPDLLGIADTPYGN